MNEEQVIEEEAIEEAPATQPVEEEVEAKAEESTRNNIAVHGNNPLAR